MWTIFLYSSEIYVFYFNMIKYIKENSWINSRESQTHYYGEYLLIIDIVFNSIFENVAVLNFYHIFCIKITVSNNIF